MSTDAVARLTAWADQDEAYRSGASDADPGGPLIEDVRAVLAEHRQQAAELTALQEAMALARPFIVASWGVLREQIVPLWQAIEPLLEQPENVAAEPGPTEEIVPS
ncbi:hypothetical protein [Actinocrinis sp.]|uniref:hypothetical protein n=1 Tax=Actinocrinis sp. TaxID=1920516 RepID=UPI002D761FA7|nr:hypothetical protein [Actinocrinis sp.]HZP55030.1 hypothetical protein [Actinocrinis sp.]